MNTGMLSRAAVSQIGSSSGSSSFSRVPSALRALQAEALVDLAEAKRAGLHVRLELLRGALAEPGPDVAEVDVREHAPSDPCAGWTRRACTACTQPIARHAAGVHQQPAGSAGPSTRRCDRTASAEIGRRLMAVDVDDRKLRPRHRMLRHDERRSRLVVADGRRRELGLPIGAWPVAGARPGSARPAAPGRRPARWPRQRPATEHDSLSMQELY